MSKNYRNGPHNEDYGTPDSLFKPLDREFRFSVDLMASSENTKCTSYITKEMNTFKVDWASYGTCGFCNPPYFQEIIEKVIIRALLFCDLCCFTTVLVLPSNKTEQLWWHKYIWDNSKNKPYDNIFIRYVIKRVKFIRADGTFSHNTEPTVIIVITKKRLRSEKDINS